METKEKKLLDDITFLLTDYIQGSESLLDILKRILSEQTNEKKIETYTDSPNTGTYFEERKTENTGDWKERLEGFVDDIFGTSDFAETPFNNYTRKKREDDYDKIMASMVSAIEQEIERAKKEVAEKALRLNEIKDEWLIEDKGTLEQSATCIDIEEYLEKLTK